MKKLSIILTVFNKGPYLRRAIESLLSQNNVQENDYEVVIVNDGSTDESADIIAEYSLKYSNIRVLTQDNQGLSMARNNGTEKAMGDYVWYVDADDIISDDSVSVLLNAMTSTPDVISIRARNSDSVDERNAVPSHCKNGKEILLSRKWEQCGVFWIFKKDFLVNNSLRFFPGIYHEDAEFTPRMLYAASSAVVIDKVLYTIVHEAGSITSIPRPKRAFDCLIISEHLADFVKSQKEVETAVGKVIFDQAAMLINNGLWIICKNERADQNLFNEKMTRNKKEFYYILKKSSIPKYRLEAFLFRLMPTNIVRTYKLLKCFS